MNFQTVIERMGEGRKFARKAWKDKTEYLAQLPNHVMPERPILAIAHDLDTSRGEFTLTRNWEAKQTVKDMAAEDWYEIGAPEEDESDE